jgi:hypothetical protein
MTIQEAVYRRLTYLEQNEDNNSLIEEFAIEVKAELEPFLNKGDADYTVLEMSLIADMVSIYLLLSAFTKNSLSTEGVSNFLKKAKAGSVEVEYDAHNASTSLGAVDAKSLMAILKDNASRKARLLGCILDICGDCMETMIKPAFKLFK